VTTAEGDCVAVIAAIHRGDRVAAAESVVLANDALAPLTGTVASTAAPVRNCTLPVVPRARVAVNTTIAPITAGLRDDTSTIDVDALFTVCTQTPEALAR